MTTRIFTEGSKFSQLDLAQGRNFPPYQLAVQPSARDRSVLDLRHRQFPPTLGPPQRHRPTSLVLVSSVKGVPQTLETCALPPQKMTWTPPGMWPQGRGRPEKTHTYDSQQHEYHSGITPRPRSPFLERGPPPYAPPPLSHHAPQDVPRRGNPQLTTYSQAPKPGHLSARAQLGSPAHQGWPASGSPARRLR